MQEAAAQYAKLATLNQDARNPSALVAYGDLLSADLVAQANEGGRSDARPHRTMALDAYARALRTQPLKTIGVALLPGQRCWLCCNSTQIEVRARGGSGDGSRCALCYACTARRAGERLGKERWARLAVAIS